MRNFAKGPHGRPPDKDCFFHQLEFVETEGTKTVISSRQDARSWLQRRITPWKIPHAVSDTRNSKPILVRYVVEKLPAPADQFLKTNLDEHEAHVGYI